MPDFKQLIAGLVIGVFIGIAFFYAIGNASPASNDAVDSQIIDLKNQIIALQSQIQQMQTQSNQQVINQTEDNQQSQIIIGLQNQITALQTENSQLKANLTAQNQQTTIVTSYEKLEFSTAYADVSGNNFVVHLNLKNTGTATAILDTALVLYNGKPASGYTAAPVCSFTKLTVNPGEATSGTITLPQGSNWVSGMTLEITLETAVGHQYPKVVTLP